MSETTTRAALPAPGELLPNGARCIASTLDRDGFVVLALTHEGTPHAEYVTWVGRSSDWATFTGHYFGGIFAAAADFEARGGC